MQVYQKSCCILGLFKHPYRATCSDSLALSLCSEDCKTFDNFGCNPLSTSATDFLIAEVVPFHNYSDSRHSFWFKQLDRQIMEELKQNSGWTQRVDGTHCLKCYGKRTEVTLLLEIWSRKKKGKKSTNNVNIYLFWQYAALAGGHFCSWTQIREHAAAEPRSQNRQWSTPWCDYSPAFLFFFPPTVKLLHFIWLND